MAADRARATAGQATDTRVPWRRRRGLASLDGRLCGATARTGWIDGQTIAIDYRWTEGHASASLRSRPSSSG